ncbi:PDF receptor-like [Aplysia californica]|uniref:PDF receptor-like n=1 Tax=Aplysia californica TaxID=6500 RepID=A0ABM1VW21_APLCA|nr:PDF receptor-like [Aplysia californica]
MKGCTSKNHLLEGVHCPAVNDTVLCWPPAAPNSTVSLPCPFGLMGSGLVAYRTCDPDGTWRDNYTDYHLCFNVTLPRNVPNDVVDEEQQQEDFSELYVVLKDIYFVTSIVSLVFLLVTLFIFCYFRSLQCSRISIHKHLVFSFIVRFVLILLQVYPYVINSYIWYRELDWLCKTMITLQKYAQMSNFAWMLVEGIYLHNRLAVSVFTSSAPFKLFYFIGWGLPLLITSVWAGLMQEFHHKECWEKYANNPLIFIVFIPILLALVINSAFLVNIIRVLVVKLRTNNTVESRRIRKAIKATVVLLPLLGVANLLFLSQPSQSGTVMAFYRVVNTVLPSCQGIFVSVLYCFMNSEVRPPHVCFGHFLCGLFVPTQKGRKKCV